MNIFDSYFKSVQETYLSDEESSEHTYRTAFENFLRAFEDENIKRKLVIKHEPTRQADKGRPDFKVTTKEQLTIGLIETKKIGEDLRKILDSRQLANYKQLSDNIILTDYAEFWLIKNGEVTLKSSIFNEFELKKKKKHKVIDARIFEMTELLKIFFESEPETIVKTQDLAYKLSAKAGFLKEFCAVELNTEKEEPGKLDGLYEAFKETLLPLLEKNFFADIYAQTLTYGLFLSALNCDDPKLLLNKHSAYSLLPASFPLIKELFHSLDDFPPEIVWAIDEIISILKVTDFAAIQREFADYRHRGKGFDDPFIFFYEDFLKHYDKEQRQLRGVYYTPEPVVSFIVRSIESILKDTFGISGGFTGKDVTLLDFATGTGTFLLNAFKMALDEAAKTGDPFYVNKILNEQLINNFYGFELLVAPYVVAHLKISEFFKELGFSLDAGKRLNIFLTNTLTNKEPHPFPTMQSLSKEGKEANRIKNKDILVILGNPPYSGHSANVDSWMQNELKLYYQVDGKPLGEKNPKWLQDDYVKFIRFAQWKMEKLDRGIIGIITNHSYLDNPTFRGMRQSLMKSFNEIYIIDLHGSTKKKEKSPDGSKDENVFDIQQGVAIAIFIKNEKNPKECRIFHHDLYGVRQAKYDTLDELNIKNTPWNKINPQSPFYLFVPRNEDLLEKYENGLGLQSIFKLNNVGIVTARDHFTIKFNKTELWEAINKFIRMPEEEARIHFELGKDTRDWKVDFAKKDLIKSGPSRSNLTNINYRPFDKRATYYTGNSRGFHCMPRKDVMVNMQEDNLAVVSVRQVSSGDFNHVLITNSIIESCYVSNRTKEIGYIYPLYILSNGVERTFFGISEANESYMGSEVSDSYMSSEASESYMGISKTPGGFTKKPNFTPKFLEFIQEKYKKYFEPEQILGYIYAVLHSPAYRTKYVEFLKIDFPRIPFTDDEELFRNLSAVGYELIEHHLLKRDYGENICKIHGETENFKVEKVSYEPAGQKAWINKDRCFAPVPEDIWNFYIGGYQVLDKWLKERKKHEITLSGDDINHFIKVVNVLGYTIAAMEKIDELTREWI